MAHLRAPGWYRAGAFLVLGVVFAAVLVTVIRLAYGFSKILRLQFSDLSPFELRTTVGEVSPASNRCDRAAGNEDRSIVDRRPGDGCDDTGP